ncbi:MAG: hypothetical protein K2X87_10950 [Gemmataceae bacterium]|nr:hypothetical protein [Gemmataceae bacterium]
MSEAWPFRPEDWSRVREAARAVVNASLADDEVLRASRLEELRLVLEEMRVGYGGHPVLWETEADFADDPADRRRLYEQAERAAMAGGWVTYSIRISLARLLLDDFNDPTTAAAELAACEPELATHADEPDRREWAELVDRCRAADRP